MLKQFLIIQSIEKITFFLNIKVNIRFGKIIDFGLNMNINLRVDPSAIVQAFLKSAFLLGYRV